MSSIFHPTEDRQVDPQKQQLLLMAPSASVSGGKRKHRGNDRLHHQHQIIRDNKRLGFDQQSSISSSPIGEQKNSGKTFSSEQHRQSCSSSVNSAAIIPTAARITNLMTKRAGDDKGRKIVHSSTSMSNNETDEGRFLEAFVTSKALNKNELEKLTGL